MQPSSTVHVTTVSKPHKSRCQHHRDVASEVKATRIIQIKLHIPERSKSDSERVSKVENGDLSWKVASDSRSFSLKPSKSLQTPQKTVSILRVSHSRSTQILVNEQQKQSSHSSEELSVPVSQLVPVHVPPNRTSLLKTNSRSNTTVVALKNGENINDVSLPRRSTKFDINPSMTRVLDTTSNISFINCSKREKSHVINDTQKDTKRRHARRFRGGWCPCCSPCCCIALGIILALLLAALATLIILLTSNKTTIKTTTTTSTSSTSDTSTTTTTTTPATTITITSNDCTYNWTGVTSLYHCDNCLDVIPYTQYTYNYVAIANKTRISFAFREDVGLFLLDDVSVVNTNAPNVELIANGGFETGSLAPEWLYCNPYGASAAAFILTGNFNWGGVTFAAHNGSNCYCDGAVTYADYVSQTFATKIGDTYNVSYWLYNHGSAFSSSADVLLSI